MRAHSMRIYGVFAAVPPSSGGRRDRFHAYLRHLGGHGAAHGSRCERLSCVFTAFSRVSASRSMTPRPFLCVFVAPWHDFVPVARGAIVKMCARCKSAPNKLMRIYGVLAGSARKVVCFCACVLARFMRICHTLAPPVLLMRKFLISMRFCGPFCVLGPPICDHWWSFWAPTLRIWCVFTGLAACFTSLSGGVLRRLWEQVCAYLRCFRDMRQELHNTRRRFHAQVPRFGMIWWPFRSRENGTGRLLHTTHTPI